MGAQNNIPALPGTKTNGTDLFPAAPSNQKYSATEFNALATAIADLRAYTLGAAQSDATVANFLTLAQNGSPPSGAATKVNLYTDGAKLFASENGDRSRRVMRPTYNVLDYGADPSGAADSTTAIQNCLNDANGHGSTYAGQVSVFSTPIVEIPAGTYRISGAGLGTGSVCIRGHNSILKAAGANPLLSISYTATIEKLIFAGGTTGVTIANGNVGAQVWLRNCQFLDQTVYSTGIDAFSNSTLLVIDACSYTENQPSGNAHYQQSGDDVFMINSLLTSGRPYPFRISGGEFTVRDTLGTPNNGSGAWVLCDGGVFSAYRFRFGGEAPKCSVEYRTLPTLLVGGSAFTPNFLVIEDCEVYNGNAPFIKFYSLPSGGHATQNFGAINPIYYDPSIPPDQRQLVNRAFSLTTPVVTDPSGDVPMSVMMDKSAREDAREAGDYLTPAERLILIPAGTFAGGSGWGSNAQTTNMSSAGGTDPFGEAAVILSPTNPALNANIGQNMYTALSGLAAGPYTLLAQFEVLSGMASLSLQAAGQAKSKTLGPGRHMIAFPFWLTWPSLTTTAWQSAHSYSSGDIRVVSNSYGTSAVWRCVVSGVSGANMNPFNNGFFNALVVDGTAQWEWLEDLSVEFGINLFGTSQIALGAWQVLGGHHNAVRGLRSTVYASAVPTVGVWRKGDKVVNTAPAPGGSEGWIVTTLGGASSGAWAQNTTYVAGVCLTSAGGVVVQCTQGGTSANSGTGPTGAAGTLSIVDGTCIWNVIANASAVFKQVSPISL